MSPNKALFCPEQPSEGFVAQFCFAPAPKMKKVNYLILRLGLTTLAAAVIYLPNLSQVANAANLSLSQSAQKKSHSRYPSYPAFLPRIISLIPDPVRNKLAYLSGIESNAETTNDNIFTEAQINQNLGDSYFDCVTIAPKAKFSLATDAKLAFLVPKTTSLSADKFRVHRVELGDTLSKLAQKYGVSLDELAQLNQIDNSDLILVDSQLLIPDSILDLTVLTAETEQPQPLLSSNFPDRRPQADLQLASRDLKTKVLGKSSTSQRQAKSNKLDRLEEDPYIAKLKAEIDEMRAEYRRELEQGKLPQNSNLASVSKINSADLPDRQSVKTLEEEEKVRGKIATSTTAEQTLETNLFPGDSVALQLPPLPSSEEYLPNAFDGYQWPAQGVLTSGYGWRWGRLHGGIDIAAPIGTPIFAAASGTVISAGWNSGGYGNLVKLKHTDGSMTLYAHNNRILVSNGQRVSKGEQIAEMGNTGFSTGSHLHFEIHPPSQGAVNPLAFLN